MRVSIDSTPAERDQVWSQLMRAAQSGERAAYERLLREATPFIRSIVRRHCSNRADIEEMVQDTLLTVHRVRHTYDPERPFAPWLAAIASRRSIDALRRRVRVSRFEAPEEGAYETFADAAANNDIEAVRSSEEVRELLRRLPPKQREALEALKLREMTLTEASASSGQSVAALKVNAHRALKALRAFFQERQPP
jgi:RNA polymerase sigma-70 factor (ECF subfamily)